MSRKQTPWPFELTVIGLLCASVFFIVLAAAAQTLPAPIIQGVTIVVPPKIVAGRPATLAVLGTDGKLAPGVSVEIGIPETGSARNQSNQRVITDATGRAYFIAPVAEGVVLVRSSGASAAALGAAVATNQRALSLAPIASEHDRFSVCGAKFSGDAAENRATINGEPALVLAASPECLVILPGPKTSPGPAKISIQTADGRWAATLTFVSLDFEPAQPPLMPDRESRLTLRVHGSGQPLSIVVENESPGVLWFLRGDTQELRTTGGSANFVQIQARAIRSGDFSFSARLLPPPDPESARRYLEAAVPLAPRDLRSTLNNFAIRIEHHPRDTKRIEGELQRTVQATAPGDLRTLLDAARGALE